MADALKAGYEKVKESIQGKTAMDQVEKAHDPTVPPSDRVDAAFAAGKAAVKSEESASKAEAYKDKHATS